MKTKLNELLKFPCFFTYKVIGTSDPTLPNKVLEVVQRHVIGDFILKEKTSRKNRYHSISISIKAINIAQIEILYKKLSDLPLVLLVL